MASSEGERRPGERKACRGRILRHLVGWSPGGWYGLELLDAQHGWEGLGEGRPTFPTGLAYLL